MRRELSAGRDAVSSSFGFCDELSWRRPHPTPHFRRFDPTPRFRRNFPPPSFPSFPHAPPQISVVHTLAVVRYSYSLLASPVLHPAVLKDRLANDLRVFDEAILKMDSTCTSLVDLLDLDNPEERLFF